MKAHLNPVDAKALLLSHLYLLLPGRREEIVELHDSLTALGMDLDFKKTTPKRTRPQEKYYRKWLGELAKAIGYSPDSLHDVVLMECFGSQTIRTKQGEYLIPAKRSADTSRGDYSELIETLIRVAAFNEFVVPPPPKDSDEK